MSTERELPDVSADHAARILARPHGPVTIPADAPEGVYEREQVEAHGPILRSIADSVEPMFPDAADLLRGIARDLAEIKAAARAEHGERIAQALEQLEAYSKDLTWELGEVLIPREAAADVARSTP